MRGALRDPQIAVDGVDLARNEQRGVRVAAEVLEAGEAVPEADRIDGAAPEQCCISAESGVYLRTFGRTFVITQSTTSFIWAASL